MLAQSISPKKFSLLFLTLLMLIGLSAPAVNAQGGVNKVCGGANLTFNNNAQNCKKDAQGNADNPEGDADKLLDRIVNVFSIIVGIIAVIMIIYGGFRYVTSGGNPESTKTARNAILYALIGLVIVAFAQFIVKFVLAKAVGVDEKTEP